MTHPRITRIRADAPAVEPHRWDERVVGNKVAQAVPARIPQDK
jgi:hypothetical protein